MKPSKEDLQMIRQKWQYQVDMGKRDSLDMALIYIVEEQDSEIESLKSLLRRATLIAKQVNKDSYNFENYTKDWLKDVSQIDSTFQDKK